MAKFSNAILGRMYARASLAVPDNTVALFGLRGASPSNAQGGGPANGHDVDIAPVDYIHPRCIIGYRTAAGQIAIYPGSTVPYGPSVGARLPFGGVGVNQLCVGSHRDYTKGMHPQSRPKSQHRALRMNKAIPVQRTADDRDFDGADRVEWATAYDNIHSAWTASPASSKFSSLGCQVVVGMPKPVESGPWKEFISAIYQLSQTSFDYALFNGTEVQLTGSVAATAKLPIVLRYGSHDNHNGAGIVQKVQNALKKSGYLTSKPDGDFGFKTLNAVFAYQREEMGQAEADGLVGPQTGAALGINNWPTV